MTPTLTRKQAAASYILSPAEAYKARREADAYEQNAPRLYWCNLTLGRVLSPMLPGEFIGMLAYTGNGKTSIALAQAYFQARQLLRDGKDLTNSVAYYTWDQPAEALERKVEKMYLRDLNVTPENYTLTHRMNLPLWWGGKNRRNSRKSGYKLPPLTLDLVDDVLDEIVGAEKRPSLVVIDYVQRVPLEKNADRADTVLRAAERLADFAARREVTMLMTIQAARTCLNRQDKTPMIHEAQWSSGIEQSCDKLVSFWRPATTEPVGTPLMVDGRIYPVDQDLMRGCVWKDRDSETHIDFAFSFDMGNMRIGDYE